MTLSHILLGQKGGENRAQIIELLRERPYNINQMAELLGVNYRTVKHHIGVLIENGLVGPSGPHGYGEVYILTPLMDENFTLFENIARKMRDITSSPTFFRSVIENTNDAVVIIDGGGEVLFWNDSARELFGYAAADVLGEQIPIFPERGFPEGIIRKVLGGEGVHRIETKGRHKDGSDLEIAITVDVIEDARKDVVGYTILASDIGELMRTRNQLEHLASFPVLNPKPVMELDESGKVIFINEAVTDALERLDRSDDATAFLPQDMTDILKLLESGEPQALRRETTVKEAVFDLVIHTIPEFKVVRIYAREITDLRRKERETIIANERLAYLLSKSPAVIYTCKTGGDLAVTYISPHVERVTGFKPSEILDSPGFWMDRIHPDDHDHVMAGTQLALEKGGYAFDYRFRHADGRYIWVYDEVGLVRDEAGNPLEFVGYWADVTDKKTSQESLRVSEERLRLGQKAGRIGTYTWNVRTDEVVFTPELEAIYGLPPGGLGNRLENWESMVHPDDLEATRSNVDLNRKSPHARPSEYRIIWPDGSVHWIAAWGQTLPGSNGEPELIIGMNMDITEQKRNEEALVASEEKCRYLFETITQGIVFQDADGLITSTNPEAIRLLGLNLDQLQGRTSMDPRWRAIHADGSEFPGMEHPSMVALRTGVMVKNVVMGVFNPQENDYVWLMVDAVPRFDLGKPRPSGVFSTFKRIPRPEQGT